MTNLYEAGKVPYMTTDKPKNVTSRGLCTHCHSEVAINRDGTTRKHLDPQTKGFAPDHRVCSGSGTYADKVIDQILKEAKKITETKAKYVFGGGHST